MVKRSLVSLSLLCLWGGQVLAEEGSTTEGEVELGVVLTSGNTETQNVNGKAKLINKNGQWRHTGKFEGLNSSDSGATTAEKYFLSGKSDYRFSEKSYVFGNLTYENDRFSGYEYRTNGTVGMGRQVVSGKALSIDLEAGAGIRQSKLDGSGAKDEESVLRVASDISWVISETTKLSEEISIDAGEDATISKSVTGLKSQIAGNLATKISLTIKNTSDVPVGIEETDTETAVTLVYSYK
ncbi:MAG: YdiY family protein [Gammaproteobacteria bacterium]